jgi:hypothetical protein
MIECIQVSGSTAATAIFFIMIMLLGNYMILNLFLAILLRFISSPDEEEEQEQADKKIEESEFEHKHSDGPLNSSNSNIEEEFEQIKLKLKELSNVNLKSGNRDFEGGEENDDDKLGADRAQDRIKSDNVSQGSGKSLSRSMRKLQKATNSRSKLQGNSCYLFGPENWLRKTLSYMVENSYFENFIMWMIFINSLLLFLDTPKLSDDYQIDTIKFMLTIIAVFFLLECVAKVVIKGFYFGKGAYLSDGFNIMDFFLVSLSVANWIISSMTSSDISFMRSFRALRALKPLRVVSKNEGIKIVVDSLLKSIPSLVNVLFIIMLFLGIFGILGVQLFKGGLGMCNDETILTKAECDSNSVYEALEYNE